MFYRNKEGITGAMPRGVGLTECAARAVGNTPSTFMLPERWLMVGDGQKRDEAVNQKMWRSFLLRPILTPTEEGRQYHYFNENT